MKHLFLVILLLTSIISLAAQENKEETLINGNIESGWALGSHGGVSVFNRQTSIISGFKAEWIINRIWFVGWHTFQTAGSNLDSPISTDEEKITMDLEYQGFLIGRMFNSTKLFHSGIETVIGWGNIDYHQENGDRQWNENYFFFAQPSLLTEINIVQWFRIQGSIGYRIVQGVDIEGLTNSDINGLTGGITLRFGRF